MRHKIHEIADYLQSTEVHMLAVSETWLGPSIPDSTITIPCFQTPFRQDRNENGGGVCLFVHNDLSCVRRNDLENPQVELMWAEVSTGSQTLLVGCCYRPPDSPKSFYEELEVALEQVHGFHLPIILLGDFNAKHSEWFAGDSTNHHGRTLKNLMDRYDMHQLVDEPTHLNHEGKPSSLLDLAFTNAPHLFAAPAEVMPPISTSDHLPVTVQCSITPKLYPIVNSEYTKWQFDLKDRHKMDNAFLYDNWEHVFQPYNDINNIWNRWKLAFFKEIESFIPKRIIRKSNHPFSAPWFTKDLKHLIRQKNRLFKRAVASGIPDHWKIYCSARNRTTAAVKRAKRIHLNKQTRVLSDPNCSPSKWWQVARDLCGLNPFATAHTKIDG